MPVFPQRLLRLAQRIPDSLLLLGARLFPAAVFWQSGRTKMDGWQINESALYLFQEEYRLPGIDPQLAAHLAAVAEHLFPVLLVLGLATRLSACGLLGMTLVIQIFVYPEAYVLHGLWAVALLTIMAHGAGVLSIDHLIRKSMPGK